MTFLRSHTFAQRIVERIRQDLARKSPLFVALDGRSGTGKSTVAALVAAEFGATVATVIEGDQFYGGGSDSTWDGRSVAEKVEKVIDWKRQRELLTELKATGEAFWQMFDWESKDWDADTIPLNPVPQHMVLTPVIILEGAYSARPELADLFDLRVLLEIEADVRREQLLAREGEAYRADWEARWSAAEDYYFGKVVPAAEFDLVVGRSAHDTKQTCI